jgi:hypothetical protein
MTDLQHEADAFTLHARAEAHEINQRLNDMRDDGIDDAIHIGVVISQSFRRGDMQHGWTNMTDEQRALVFHMALSFINQNFAAHLRRKAVQHERQ